MPRPLFPFEESSSRRRSRQYLETVTAVDIDVGADRVATPTRYLKTPQRHTPFDVPMLTVIWVLLSVFVALGQFVMLSQTDWVFRGADRQGLFAICRGLVCQLRMDPCSTVILSGYLLGAGGMWFSVLVATPYLMCTNHSRPVAIAANVQFLSAMVTAIALLAVPFDVAELNCAPQELIKPLEGNCKLGWTYGIACILGLISMCCPVIARLMADQRKTYSIMYHNQYLI